jgi:hypothetical protein
VSQLHASAALVARKGPRYQVDRRSGQKKEILSVPGINNLLSHFTDDLIQLILKLLNMSLVLIKNHAMKTYGLVDV